MNTINIDNETKALEDIKSTVTKYAKEHGFTEREQKQMNLVMEEMMEISRISGNVSDRCFTIDSNGPTCILTLELSPGNSGDISFKKLSGISQKIKVLLGTNFETIEANEKEAEDIGVRRADHDSLSEMDCESVSDAYIWTIESYNMAAYNRYIKGDEEDWMALSTSILAAFAKDVRVFILKGCILFSVILLLGKNKSKTKASDGISPEFAQLAKIPLCKTRFQVKLVQIMYGRLVERVKASGDVIIERLKMTVPTASKGQLDTLIYVPAEHKDDTASSVILFLHGGAFLFPALPYHYKLAEELAKRTGCKVMLPMHELAPYRQPPVQIKEALDVYTELQNNPEKYGIDPKKIFIMGDSSGGNMAAALTLLVRDRGFIKPKATLLLYPALDLRYKTDSMSRFTDVPVLNSDTIDAYRKIVTTDKEEGLKYYSSPAEAESLSDLNPIYVETAEFDPLHDEGVNFAKRLKTEGVDVTLNETRGTVHAFDMAKDSSIQRAAVNERLKFIKRFMD